MQVTPTRAYAKAFLNITKSQFVTLSKATSPMVKDKFIISTKTPCNSR